MFVICFISQWMKRSKHGLFVFPPKKTLILKEKALFNWPIVLQYDVRAKYRFISRTNQPKATRVCIRSINQSNRSISVRLLFLFSSRAFISRSYEIALLLFYAENITKSLYTSTKCSCRVMKRISNKFNKGALH